jgi:hypothetical protein
MTGGGGAASGVCVTVTGGGGAITVTGGGTAAGAGAGGAAGGTVTTLRGSPTTGGFCSWVHPGTDDHHSNRSERDEDTAAIKPTRLHE